MVPCCYLCDEEVVVGDDYQAHLQIVHGVNYDEKRNLEKVETLSDRARALSPCISITRTSVAQAPATTVTVNKLGRALELLGQTRGEKREVLLELTESQIEGLWALGIQGKEV